MALNSRNMATEMESAFRAEWDRVKDIAFPDAGEEDRMMLFYAVARGVMKYLYDHRNEIPTTNQHDTSGGHTHTMNFTIE
jgi:hypothetical protein